MVVVVNGLLVWMMLVIREGGRRLWMSISMRMSSSAPARFVSSSGSLEYARDVVREEGGFERFRWRLRRVTTDGAVEADSLDANEECHETVPI